MRSAADVGKADVLRDGLARVYFLSRDGMERALRTLDMTELTNRHRATATIRLDPVGGPDRGSSAGHGPRDAGRGPRRDGDDRRGGGGGRDRRDSEPERRRDDDDAGRSQQGPREGSDAGAGRSEAGDAVTSAGDGERARQQTEEDAAGANHNGVADGGPGGAAGAGSADAGGDGANGMQGEGEGDGGDGGDGGEEPAVVEVAGEEPAVEAVADVDES